MNYSWVYTAAKRNWFRLIAITLVVILNAGLSKPAITAQENTAAKAINLDAIAWGPPGGGNGFPVGVRTAQQGLDSATLGVTYYALFPAGSKFDSHWHSHDEFVVVAKGSVNIVLADEVYALTAGAYIVIPGAVKHEWIVPQGAEDAIILVRRAGPADFHFAETP
ncbi:MAG: mannose-6-phosphate isomerase-like protein (cupin superfamily) [Pseudohongiellaceae bacterium]